jgi:hypothetical protein
MAEVGGPFLPAPTDPGEREKKPDDVLLFDLLLIGAPNETARHRILVENPAIRYDFPKTT